MILWILKVDFLSIQNILIVYTKIPKTLNCFSYVLYTGQVMILVFGVNRISKNAYKGICTGKDFFLLGMLPWYSHI